MEGGRQLEALKRVRTVVEEEVQITVEKVKRQKGTLTNKEKQKMKSRTKMKKLRRLKKRRKRKKYDSAALLPWKKKCPLWRVFFFFFPSLGWFSPSFFEVPSSP